MKNVSLTEKPQLSIGLSFTFMGVDLNSYYSKTSTGYEIFLAPSNISNDVQLSIEQMVKEFNAMFGKEELTVDDVTSKIQESENSDLSSNVDLTKLKLCLKMLFLDIKSEKITTESGETEEKTIEYALSLEILADELIPKEIKIFNINSLSFNIWNTQRENVLDRMALVTPESF